MLGGAGGGGGGGSSGGGRGSFAAFDLFPKSIEEVRKQTLGGGIVTLAAVVLGLLLFVSEFAAFLSVEEVDRLSINELHEHDAVDVHIDVTFSAVHCDELQFIQENTRGNVHVTNNVQAEKKIVDIKGDRGAPHVGCNIVASMKVDKVGGDFQVRYKFVEGKHELADKTGANGHIMLTPGPLGMQMRRTQPVDLSHVINKFEVGEPLSDTQNPLTGLKQELTHDTGLYQYQLSFIPVVRRWGENGVIRESGFQTSATEQAVAESTLPMLSPAQNPGVVWQYDWSPVQVVRYDESPGFLSFLTSTIAIVGGLCATLSAIESLVYASSQAMGKKD